MITKSDSVTAGITDAIARDAAGAAKYRSSRCGSHIEIVKVGRWRYELSWHPDGGWIELAGPRVWGLRRAKRRAARHLRRLEPECVTVARVTSLGIDPEEM